MVGIDSMHASAGASSRRRYNLFLLLVAGLGGLLYGVDVGIIGGALPYLEATSHLTAAQLSVIVAAVLLGSVFSTLFAGIAGRLDGPQAADDSERSYFCGEHPGDCSLAGIWAAVFRTAAARRERRTDRRGGSAVSCGVPGGAEPRQRERASSNGC